MMWFQKISDFLKKSLKEKLSRDAAVILLVFIISLSGFFFGEKIAEIGLFGDELVYRNLARDFPGEIIFKRQSSFRMQRSLPMFSVYYGLKLFQLPHTDEMIFRAFGLCTVALLTLSGWFWCQLVRLLQISNTGKWLGFIALFLNYPILKQAPYCPIATDYYAFCMGFSLIYFYLKDNFLGIYITSLIAAFCWPILPYIAILLVAFPKERHGGGKEKPARFFLNYLIALGVAGAITYKTIYWYTGERAVLSFMTHLFSTGTNRPNLALLNVSIALVVIYLFFALSILLNSKKIFQPKYIFQNMSFLRPFILIAAISGIKFFLSNISGRRETMMTLSQVVKDTLGGGIMQPLLFLLSHIIFYGPFIIFFVLFWKRTVRIIQKQGLGLVMCCVLCIILSLHSESRRMINFYPIFIPFLIKALDDFEWPRAYLWFLTLVSLFGSKAWLTIHSRPWDGGALVFPQQNYFMNYGPWMNNQMYMIQGAVVSILFIIFLILFKWDPFKFVKIKIV